MYLILSISDIEPSQHNLPRILKQLLGNVINETYKHNEFQVLINSLIFLIDNLILLFHSFLVWRAKRKYILHL